MATDPKEEAYVLEDMEFSDIAEDDFQYEELKVDEEAEKKSDSSEEEDLNNYEQLKAKTTLKMLQHQSPPGAAQQIETLKTTLKAEPKPHALQREVVIDDFIRNFLAKFKLDKSLNVFQQEWHELQKKGVFNDTQIGLITDVYNKNERLKERVGKMRTELKDATVRADRAKSTWEKLRKERDFHKTHHLSLIHI